MIEERQAHTEASNSSAKKQLLYGFLGYAVLTAIVFAFLVYPDLAKTDQGSVSSGIILSIIAGFLVDGSSFCEKKTQPSV